LRRQRGVADPAVAGERQQYSFVERVHRRRSLRNLTTATRRWLTNDRRRRVFNAGMAVLLVAALWPVLKH